MTSSVPQSRHEKVKYHQNNKYIILLLPLFKLKSRICWIISGFSWFKFVKKKLFSMVIKTTKFFLETEKYCISKFLTKWMTFDLALKEVSRISFLAFEFLFSECKICLRLKLFFNSFGILNISSLFTIWGRFFGLSWLFFSSTVSTVKIPRFDEFWVKEVLKFINFLKLLVKIKINYQNNRKRF